MTSLQYSLITDQWAISEFSRASFSKRGWVLSLWYGNHFFIFMEIKFIFTRKVLHLASFWKWGFLELGSGLLEHWIFLKKIYRRIWFNRCFRESSFRNYKKSSALRFSKSHKKYLGRSDGCRVYKGHLQNEWVIKNFWKHQKSSEFFSIKSSVQFMHNLHPFRRNSKISRNACYRFLWNFAQQKTSTQSISSVKHIQRKCR